MKSTEDKLRQLVERSGRHITKEETLEDGTIRFSLDVCFFDESHQNCSAIFFRPDTGEAFYNCFHNSCKKAGKDQGRWIRDAFKRFAPDLLKDDSFTRTAAATEAEDYEDFDIISAYDLDQIELPPTRWIVQDLLPSGVAILAAPSKSYKSFMALQLCIAVCNGEKFLNHDTKKASCLYFDLESTKKRPQSRLRMILGDEPKPKNLYIITAERKRTEGKRKKKRLLGAGFEEEVSQILTKHPDIKLVVIDVFTKIRRPAKRSADAYDRDYEDISLLKELQDKHDVCILIIHHTRKLKDSDVFNTITGSVGIMGSVDLALMINRETRADTEATLHVTGRDVEQQEIAIEFDRNAFVWTYKGTHEEIAERKRAEAYRSDPVVRTILALMKADSTWTGSMRDLKTASQFLGSHISASVQGIGQTVSEFEGELWGYDHIRTERDRSKDIRIVTFTKEK